MMHNTSGRAGVRPAPYVATIILLALLACNGDQTGGPSPVGAVAGTVVTLEGQGISEARLDLMVGGASTASLLTDSGGAFEFRGIPNGSYVLELRLPAGFEPVARGAQHLQAGVLVDSGIEVAGATTSIQLAGRAMRSDTAVVGAGGTVTLATSSGAVLLVDASAATQPVEVSLEERPTRSLDSVGILTTPVYLRVASAGAVRGSQAVRAQAGSAGTIGLRLIQRVGNVAVSAIKFILNAGTEAQPIYLFADAQATTYTDPRTGVSTTVPLYSADVDAGVAVDAWISAAETDTDCQNERYLRPVDGNPSSDARIPVILIHGIQLFDNRCEEVHAFDPTQETFKSIIAALQADPGISSKYRLYVARYPTLARVLATSEFLWNEMARQDVHGAVLIGHSMGGLVGRGLLAAHPDADVRAIITLGTPHEGSALANVVARPTFSLLAHCFTAGNAFLPLGSLWPNTNGVDDLRPDGEFITRLKSATAQGNKVFSFAGQLGSEDNALWAIPACVLASLSNDSRSDGVVTVSSAVPSWTALQTVVPGHSHFEMASGDATAPNALFDRVKTVLRTLAVCTPAPAPPAANDFPLSGSIARVNGRDVDVTLNPIVINGTPVTGLTQTNFKVIENGCVLPAPITTSTGSVGVDIAFVQDLSSSMSTPIAGVRSSVVAFAADLASRGINARIGSVGYSGPGTIPSSPPTSSCEFLGPFRDLTDVGTFQTHVQTSWLATGGCDGPENGLEAIEYAHQHLSWRPGAARVYIDITDVSHHTASTSCNGLGACTDETLATITALVGTTSTIHAVAPSLATSRTYGGGLDPWLLADNTGGQKLALGSGSVDLTALGIANVIGQVVRLTFQSASPDVAYHRLRIRVEVNGKVAELSPGLIQYAPVHPSLAR